MIDEHARMTHSLETLDNFLKTLVTPDHRDTYEPAKEFVEQCNELRQKWLELEDTLKHLHDDIGKKVRSLSLCAMLFTKNDQCEFHT